ncbi:MAG: HAMP domain-containing sensor histidine kinase, partial [Candidatus Omnitrophica bacterium]|nr:HAMP domain-containing sensor histidine kinase [Candidatus Omnitrophota bacterium]
PGSKYNERVYYVSYPFKDTAGAVNAVIIAAKIISVKPVLQYRFFSIFITFFVCILAITLFIALRKRETLIEFIDKANSQLQEIDKLKTDFISIVSHELRTPLTSIKNASTILLKGKLNKKELDPEEKELIEIIIKNTERQMRMVSDLLDISKIEAGVLPVCAENVDVNALIRETVRSLQPEAEEKDIRLEFSLSLETHTIHIDPEHTRRIIVNLLSNAIKFTPEEGLIRVSVKDEGKEALFSVSDSGAGIPKNERVKLFSKFYRSSDPATSQRGGTGLGLVITKGLVEAQGGRIWFESTVGKGSIFYFTLPK